MNETVGLEQEAKKCRGDLGNGTRDSIPSDGTRDRDIQSVYRDVPLDQIELDPRLSNVYKEKNLHFPPEPPPGFLTATGIRMAARLLPIHGVAHEGKIHCFAGVRLWLAALNTLPRGSTIKMFVYESFKKEYLPSIVEMEEDILYIWHRQSAGGRKSAEHNYLNSASSSSLRLNFDGKDQEAWKNILKISLKTLQNRLTSRQGKA